MQNQSRFFFVIGLVLATVATGCRPAVRFPVAAVSGRVTFDGVPAARVRVRFSPLGSTAEVGPPSEGTTADDGRFILRLCRENAGEGAVVGEHVVTITGLEAHDELIDMIRSQANGSPKDTPGVQGQTPTLQLPKAEELPTVRIPKRYQRSLRYTVPKQGTDRADFVLTAK